MVFSVGFLLGERTSLGYGVKRPKIFFRVGGSDELFVGLRCANPTYITAERFAEVVRRAAFIGRVADLDILVRGLPAKGGGFLRGTGYGGCVDVFAPGEELYSAGYEGYRFASSVSAGSN